MDIKKVEYRKPDPKAKAGKTWTHPHFFVTTTDGSELTVPMDVNNRDYTAVREWYDDLTKKPFTFNFETPEENDAGFSEPIIVPMQEATEPDPENDPNEVNLTPKQLKEIDAERKQAVRTGSAAKRNA